MIKPLAFSLALVFWVGVAACAEQTADPAAATMREAAELERAGRWPAALELYERAVDADGGHDPIPDPVAEPTPSRWQMLGNAVAHLATQPFRQGRVAARLPPAGW